MRINNLLSTFFYFTLFITVGLLLPALLFIQSAPLSPVATSLDVQNYFGSSDPGFFASAAWIIYKNNWQRFIATSYNNLWPPGFMLLQAAILKVFGANAPLVLILQMLAAFLLAIACNFFRVTLRIFLRNEIIILLLPLSLLLFSQFRFFMLAREGVMLGETFSISFVLIGLFCTFLACARNQKIFAVSAGLAFALSAYFRSQFETFFTMACFMFIGILLFKLIKNNVLKVNHPLTIILVVLLAFQGFTLPYRIYNYWRIGTFMWVQTTTNLVRNNFTTTEKLASLGGGFVIDGGGNVACRVDPQECDKINKRILNNSITDKELKKIFLLTFAKHPLQWLYLKIQPLPKYWFSSVNKYMDFCTPGMPSHLAGFVFLICFVFSTVWSFVSRKNPYSFLTLWLSASVCVAYVVIFIVAHFEVRYFYFFKFYFFVTALLGVSQLIGRLQNRRPNTLIT